MPENNLKKYKKIKLYHNLKNKIINKDNNLDIIDKDSYKDKTE